MRQPRKFSLSHGVKEDRVVKQEVMGYDFLMHFDGKLKLFTSVLPTGWIVAEVKSGCLVGSVIGLQTEEDAVNGFMQLFNTVGLEGVLKGISDYEKKNQDEITAFKENKKKESVHTPNSADVKGETGSIPLSSPHGVPAGEASNTGI